jgi:hypothetical protein
MAKRATRGKAREWWLNIGGQNCALGPAWGEKRNAAAYRKLLGVKLVELVKVREVRPKVKRRG